MSAWAVSLAKGDEVRVVVSGLREDSGNMWFWDRGEEGQVRRVYANGDVEVRTFDRAGYRARFSPDEVEAVHPVGTPPPGGLDAHDQRLAWVWEDAARLAERKGWCSEFDALCDALGVPGRVRKFSITMHDAGGCAGDCSGGGAFASPGGREAAIGCGRVDDAGGRVVNRFTGLGLALTALEVCPSCNTVGGHTPTCITHLEPLLERIEGENRDR